MIATRELNLVELVTPTGESSGSATVAEAHTAPGQLHRAFSVLLIDQLGRILLQQRAATKTRFPLRWANSCCGHPSPGEVVTAAATRRLAEELGVSGVPLTEVGVYLYRAADPATDRVEHEYDHVLIGHTTADLSWETDPNEVADTRWAHTDDLLAELRQGPVDQYAPWLLGVLEVGLAGAPPERGP